MIPTDDLLVVGGGVVGLAAALEATRRGLTVTVVERGTPGRGSSWAAAGMLSPLGEAPEGGPYLDFGLESLRIYRAWVEELVSDSGIDCEYRELGKLRLARAGAESLRLEHMRNRAEEKGLRVEWLGPQDLQREAPQLSGSFHRGLIVHDDFRLDNRRLVAALLGACETRGVRILAGEHVKAIRIDGGRTLGLSLSDGRPLDGEAVLVAAGAWSNTLGGLPGAIGVRPIRGQMLALTPEAPVCSRVLESEAVYLVPREDGRLLVGATMEDVGFSEANTVGGLLALLEAAVDLVPELEDAPVREIWSGLRPGTHDGNPVLGGDPDVDGLYYATGHFRNGILLAPMTARIMGALISGSASPSIPAEFSPRRAGSAGSSRQGT